MRRKRGPMARARCGGRLGEAMVVDDARLAGKRTRVGVASRPASKKGRRRRKCFQLIEAEKILPLEDIPLGRKLSFRTQWLFLLVEQSHFIHVWAFHKRKQINAFPLAATTVTGVKFIL